MWSRETNNLPKRPNLKEETTRKIMINNRK